MNDSLISNQQPCQQLQQIIKLKVQLTMAKSRIQGYKQIQMNYKRLTVKAQAIQKQLAQYHKVMETFFQKLKRLMNLLNIDYLNIFANDQFKTQTNSDQFIQKKSLYYDSKDKVNDSITFNNSNMSPNSYMNSQSPNLSANIPSNASLMRRINKINSLKSISHTQTPIEFTHQDAKFQLIESAIKSLLHSNIEYKTTLQQYEQSSINIEMNVKQQEVIMRRLQSQIRLKEQEIDQRDGQIANLLRKIDQIKDDLNEKEQIIQNMQKQHSNLVKTYEDLQHKIHQLKNQNIQQEYKKQTCRNTCIQLLDQLKLPDSNYLTHYFQQHFQLTNPQKSTPLIYSFNPLNIDKQNQIFSQSRKKNKILAKNKYQMVFQ